MITAGVVVALCAPVWIALYDKLFEMAGGWDTPDEEAHDVEETECDES